MALLVTLFLVLVNIFNSVTGNAPKAEGLTAVETWVVSCIIHVFAVLAEYAVILKIIQNEKRRDAKERRSFLKSLNNVNGTNRVDFQETAKPRKSIRRDIGKNSFCGNSVEEVFETEPICHKQIIKVVNSDVKRRHRSDDSAKTVAEIGEGVNRDKCVREKIQEAYEKVDRFAMILFPVIFFIFNGLYWSYYLVWLDMFNISFRTPDL